MQPNSVIFVLSLAATVGLLAAGWLLLRRKPQSSGFAQDWRAVDVTRYRPMLRLLAADDLDYPHRAAPLAGDIAARLRSRHLALFRAYLRALCADFNLLQDAGHELIAAGVASPMLSEALLRSKVEFNRSLWSIRFRLIGMQFGLNQVDAGRLLGAAAQMQLALRPAEA